MSGMQSFVERFSVRQPLCSFIPANSGALLISRENVAQFSQGRIALWETSKLSTFRILQNQFRGEIGICGERYCCTDFCSTHPQAWLSASADQVFL